ncbi:MAG: hypothetical protein HRU09_09630 [Oligoflexales bacterium]|nr:hypothetical protein [Oligoflexales bacterium]
MRVVSEKLNVSRDWGAALLNVCFCFILADLGYSQSSDDNTVSEGEIKTVLDDAPFISARAAGMGGALSTVADGIHAPFYNPAGIGGIHWGRKKAPIVRQLHFPYLGLAANENATELNREFTTNEDSTNRVIGKAIVDANAGKGQYARASGLFSLVVSRLAFVQYQDSQIAAFRKTDETDGEISAAIRNQSGTGFGFSISDSRETLYLGAYTSYNYRRVFAGDFDCDQLVRQEERKAFFIPRQKKYTGMASNAGMIWVMGQYWRPSLALVSKNLGGSLYHYQGNKDFITPEEKTLEDKENISIGFSLSPRIGKHGAFNFIVEGQHLMEKEIALNKKFRTAMELNLGGFGSEAIFGARAGYNLAGASFGLSLNLDLVQFELASHAEDIGIGNRHVVERRNMGVFSVNVLYE